MDIRRPGGRAQEAEEGNGVWRCTMFSSATQQIMFLSRFLIGAHIQAEYIDWLGGAGVGMDCWN